MNRKLDELMGPGGHPPVEVFGFLAYIPERWASWKESCRSLRARQQKYFLNLVDRCLDRMSSNKLNGSFMEYLLEHGAEYEIDREKA